MDITSWVLDSADADDTLREAEKLVVLAALEGDQDLDLALGSDTYTRRAALAGSPKDTEPARAFLKSITVEGFRGIGPKATLGLNPSPGLVVVAGRNGSGKSSFAEALEIALTGASYRWAKRAALWRDTWRNLHHLASCHVGVEIVAEGRGRISIGLDWKEGAQLEDRSAWVQRATQKREPGLESLGWRVALELYRPVLSYDELGGMLEGEPSRLFDALEGFLGLEQLTEAAARLSLRVKQLGEPERQAKAKANAVKPLLAGVDDSRAVAASDELKKRVPNLAHLRTIVAGGPEGIDPQLVSLRELARLQLPSEVEVSLAADELHSAAAEYAAVSEQVVAVAAARADLLRQALAFHGTHGDSRCPVCGVGELDEAWAARVGAALAETRGQSRLVDAARQRLETARSEARRLMVRTPRLLELDSAPLPSLVDMRTAWRRRAEAPADDAGLVVHLRAAYPGTTLAQLRSEAAAEAESREDAWSTVAVPLAAWVEAATEATDAAPVLRLAEMAYKWVTTNTATLRNQRLEPLAEEARYIWAELRQGSNVDLGSISLEGSKTRRRVDLRARVDGTDTGALPIMSQGELHALALALFIPRASSAASPFRFLVLDDPIQAMDPGKVDGFVRVLTELAVDRQVIVFSHDDRLPEAVRRTSTPARILEISRGTGSEIRVVNSLDPAQRYLDDALAVAHDDGLQGVDKARIVPDLCRLALEATCRDTFYARRLTTGAVRGDVEAEWQRARLTRQRVQLAVDPHGTNLDAWLSGKPWRKSGLGICTSAAHEGLRTDPLGAVQRVRELVADIKAVR